MQAFTSLITSHKELVYMTNKTAARILYAHLQLHFFHQPYKSTRMNLRTAVSTTSKVVLWSPT
jgi:hypothetical protein